ncbi:putative DBH-like monooxygenase protein 2 [Littorina saxatilis]|uniref:Temptin n=1 Tax=Littorina saxatilis TaxID=31220 RepID=A0AAN9GCK4_9CAEN
MRPVALLQVALCLACGCHGYRDYQDELPNGGRVAHPCKDNALWHGVGHLNVQGGGARNVFGLDFADAGRKWTRELCQKDSDGDGKTNGQELGDPQCTWTKGGIPESTSGITHPGVCDPYDSEKCQNTAVPPSPGVTYATQAQWMKEACVQAEFECPALESSDVKQLDLRMPLTPVPQQETTYMCMTFQWPDVTKDFHVIATEPIINNSYIMHHMLLFGCADDFAVSAEPSECGMGGCPDLLGAWSLGVTGQCFHTGAGVLMGQTGYKRLMIQSHWNNPQLHAHFNDSSGMRLHYTSELRANNMAMLMTGQNYIQIPPRSPDTLATSDCSSTCTNNLMTGDIHITSAANHMHYLGTAMNLELHRNGRFLMNLTNDVIYDYDTPKFYEYTEPVVIHPGDMIRTNCHFASLDKATTTFEGDATSDEMCYGFLTFFPRENLKKLKCTSWRGLSGCDPPTEGGCDTEARQIFFKPAFNQTELYKNLTSVCKPFGPCTTECNTALRQAMQSEPCFRNPDSLLLIKWYLLQLTEAGRNFLGAMATCELQLYKDCLAATDTADDIVCRNVAGGHTMTNGTDDSGNDGTGGALALQSTSLLTLLGLMVGTLYHALS